MPLIRLERMGGITISFLGAAGTVTGSRFLLSNGKTKILVDAGLFQGIKELRLRNWEPFEIEPKEISAIVLTHAHLDHCGYIPSLVKQGYDGKVYSTEYTAKLADIILRDSARIQVEDAKYAARKGFSKHNPPKPLYDENDANRALERFRSTEFKIKTKIAEESFVTFHPAGHILGASVVEIEFFGKRILFSGDLGRPEHPLLTSPENIPEGAFDAIVIESTYGDREHGDEKSNLTQVIRETVKRGGSILIPAFAVDRTEVILVELKKLLEAGAIPTIPVYADSPMALKALALYREAINGSSPEIRADVLEDKLTTDPFDSGQLVELPTVEDSMSVNNPTSPCIIISASGMATGGRVVHHLANMLPVPKHTIVLVGYQAVGTRGRRLLEGEEFIKIHGKEIPVKAQIEQINSFSVHADASELIDWLRTSSVKPKHLFIVHGEGDSSVALQEKITQDLGWKSVIPKDNQVLEI